MTPTRSLPCGCRARALAPVVLAARRGHGPSATPPARSRHGAGARHAGQNPGVQGYSPMFVAALDAAGISRDQIQTLGRETPAALLMG